MPRVTGLNIEGLPELLNTLEQLPKATARNTLKRGLTKAAKPVLDAMERSAPRDSGWTAGSLAISGTLNPANRRDQKKETKSFAEVHVGSTRGSAAVLQEYGTVNHPPHPYFRPAWAQTQNEALAIFEEELATEINKSAARYAKKLAKG